MRDRYSIVVGLIFLAVIVVATINTLERRRGGETLGLDKLAGALAAAGVRGARRPPGSSKATPTSPRTTAKARALPCPEGARRDARLPDPTLPERSASATSSTGRW